MNVHDTNSYTMHTHGMHNIENDLKDLQFGIS